jgi:hypothetical protein
MEKTFECQFIFIFRRVSIYRQVTLSLISRQNRDGPFGPEPCDSEFGAEGLGWVDAASTKLIREVKLHLKVSSW